LCGKLQQRKHFRLGGSDMKIKLLLLTLSILLSVTLVNAQYSQITGTSFQIDNLTILRCYTNSDCNDQISSTDDLCINPGTFESTCHHRPIMCFSNQDCNDGNPFTGDTCLHPGNVESICGYKTIIPTLTRRFTFCTRFFCI